jgi:hypothetical protein
MILGDGECGEIYSLTTEFDEFFDPCPVTSVLRVGIISEIMQLTLSELSLLLKG